MCREDPAGIFFFSFWADRANDTNSPLWLRLTAHAYASFRKNGHASFDLPDGSILPELLGKSRQQINNEIRRAVRLGYLAEGSNIDCLIVPGDICGGAEGNRFAECNKHPAKH